VTHRDSALRPSPSQDTPLQRLGATLRQYRQQRGLTHRTLAARIGIRHSYISEIERGKRNISVLTLLRITTVLQLPAAWFLGQVDPHAVQPSATAHDPARAYGARDDAPLAAAGPPRPLGDPSTLLPLLGTTIRQARQRQGLSQAALAGKTGLSLTYIIEIENGHRNLSVLSLLRITEALALTVASLLMPLDPYHPSAPSRPP
jgi:transcriptional regulator with XRE-family HTH domain